MASTLDPRQVLAYLNQLGYKNITADQLKDFMKDLKKLIKYEEKYKLSEFENIPPAFPYHTIAPPPSVSAPTESSKAKQVPKRGFVSIEAQRPGPSCHCLDHQSPSKQQSFQSSTPNQSEGGTDRPKLYSRGSEATNIQPSETTSSESSKRPKSCEPVCQKGKSGVKFKGHAVKSKAFIIPRGPIKTLKSDPVALYHEYQKYWDKHKLPGEDNHSKLRWVIRERMLGEPRGMSAASSMEVIPKKCRIR